MKDCDILLSYLVNQRSKKHFLVQKVTLLMNLEIFQKKFAELLIGPYYHNAKPLLDKLRPPSQLLLFRVGRKDGNSNSLSHISELLYQFVGSSLKCSALWNRKQNETSTKLVLLFKVKTGKHSTHGNGSSCWLMGNRVVFVMRKIQELDQ